MIHKDLRRESCPDTEGHRRRAGGAWLERPRRLKEADGTSAPEHGITASRSAAEHAREEWLEASHSGIFTSARAQTVPQGDRMGKKAVWRIVEELLSSKRIPIEDEDPRVGLDITNGEVLR